MEVIITSPALEPDITVSGISTVSRTIISYNGSHSYRHFEIGKRDAEVRNLTWFLRTLGTYVRWGTLLLTKPRLIHFNLPLDKRALFRDVPLIVAARLLRRRIVLHLHGGDLLFQKDAGLFCGLLLRAALGGPEPKIVLSVLERDVLLQKIATSTGSIFVLPNCVAVDDAKTVDRTGRKGEMLKLLFMGRIAPGKRLDCLLDAFRALRARGTAFKFCLAGRGPGDEGYVSRFRELLGTDFEFYGVVSGQQKAALLRHCNVFLLPSEFEGLPMALLESMAFGLVPVTTDVGSIQTVVTDKENGILLTKPCSDEMAAALEKLAQDKDYMWRLSTGARQSILSKHGPEKYVERLNTIYSL
jgi:glycosyltransferase involved in cell wall biosynthesis